MAIFQGWGSAGVCFVFVFLIPVSCNIKLPPGNKAEDFLFHYWHYENISGTVFMKKDSILVLTPNMKC